MERNESNRTESSGDRFLKPLRTDEAKNKAIEPGSFARRKLTYYEDTQMEQATETTYLKFNNKQQIL